MSLSFNGSQNQANINENWLFNITHSGGNLYLALADVTESSNFYYGAITNNPKIRESIDLVNSRSRTANTTINVANFDYSGSPLSEEIFNSSNFYLNRSVSVSIKVGADNAVVVGTFRILSLSFNGDIISIQMAAKRPWDDLTLPTDKSTTSVYVPVVYGDYTAHSTTDFMTGKAMHPVPRTSNSGQNIYFLSAKSYGSGAIVNYFDDRADIFANLELNNAATVTRDGKDAYEVKGKIKRTYKFRPKAVASSSGFTNPANTIDTDTSTAATQSFTGNSGSQTADLKLELPSISGKFTTAFLNYNASITISSINDASTATLIDKSFGSTTLFQVSTATTDNQASGTRNILSDIQSNSNRLPDDLVLTFQLATVADGTEASCSIKDVHLVLTVEEDFTNEPNASALAELNLDEVYSGNDGLTASWDSSAITKIHEIHRDILIRFAGVTTSTPSGYSDLNTSRSQSNKEWFARFYLLDPNNVQKQLEALQFEGGFIFRFKSDDSPQYIYIKDSYSSADFTLSKNDINNFRIRNTSTANLATTLLINYELHPGNQTYIKSQTATNSTTRTNYNIATKENIKEVNLRYLVSNGAGTVGGTNLTTGNPNDGFADYYGYFVSNVKTIVECDIVNPEFIGVEVGDIVTFDSSDMYPSKAFGSSWANKAYMLTSVAREPRKLSIQLREVGVIS
tara:strand:- start:5317 stop:7368 length:2052 start_codon:yes stop_codon:yes gene_type:complete